MGEPDWVWREQYELEPEKDLDGDMEPDCKLLVLIYSQIKYTEYYY